MFELEEIKEIETFESEGIMYDLSVEDVKSYNANGFIVHNSAYCAGLDGKVFKKSDSPTPPAHYQCRSTLVPYTTIEAERTPPDVKDRQEIEAQIIARNTNQETGKVNPAAKRGEGFCHECD